MATKQIKKIPKKPLKKKSRSTVKRSSSTKSVDVTRFFIPASLAFIITWAFSASLHLSGVIFLVVLIVNWFGLTYRTK